MGLEFPPYVESGAASWDAITGKPTTVAGFGISDALTLTGDASGITGNATGLTAGTANFTENPASVFFDSGSGYGSNVDYALAQDTGGTSGPNSIAGQLASMYGVGFFWFSNPSGTSIFRADSDTSAWAICALGSGEIRPGYLGFQSVDNTFAIPVSISNVAPTDSLVIDDSGNLNMVAALHGFTNLMDASSNQWSSLFDGSGGNVRFALIASEPQSLVASGNFVTTDGTFFEDSGFSDLNFQPVNGNLTAIAAATPIADGTYTVGLGVTNNGTVTTVGGIITAITQAS